MPTTQDPPPAFDYNVYLDFLVAQHHNFFRLWRWEAPKWTDAQPKGVIKFCEPHPWMRTGPGAAADGKPKFDLTKFSPDYFDRMRSRIIAARDRGIYVSIMLFEGWELQFTDAWTYHPFNSANNINGIDGGPDERFKDNPWPARTDKVIVNDTDHLWGHTGGDAIWVWKSFMRGLNVLFMEELLPSPTWQDSARQAMGQTRGFAEKMNLAE